MGGVNRVGGLCREFGCIYKNVESNGSSGVPARRLGKLNSFDQEGGLRISYFKRGVP